MESKITDLEIRLTHQEAAIEEINGVLLTQHGMLEAIKSDLIALKRQLGDMATSNIADLNEETPPPHY